MRRSGATLLAAMLAKLPKFGPPNANLSNPGLGIPYALTNSKLTAHWLARYAVAGGLDTRAGPHAEHLR